MKFHISLAVMVTAGLIAVISDAQDVTAREMETVHAAGPALQLRPYWKNPFTDNAPVPVVQIEELGIAGERRSASHQAGPVNFIDEPIEGEMLAGTLPGTAVVGNDGEPVALVSDLLLNRENQVVGLVVTFGSVEGFGGKQVAIPDSRISFDRIDGGQVVTVKLSPDQLAEAPAFAQRGTRGGIAGRPGWFGWDGNGALRFTYRRSTARS